MRIASGSGARVSSYDIELYTPATYNLRIQLTRPLVTTGWTLLSDSSSTVAAVTYHDWALTGALRYKLGYRYQAAAKNVYVGMIELTGERDH